MGTSPVILSTDGRVAGVTLNDPDRRNALGLAMFNGLDDALTRLHTNDSVNVVVFRGAGSAFCAGFDLAAAVEQPELMGTYIERLSGVLRAIRRLPQTVIASVHGAAIAGGCAMLSACDFLCVSDEATLGYPVHALGVSPAVTLPTLMQLIGEDPARSLVMTGRVIDGIEAQRIGLASHRAPNDEELVAVTNELAQRLASHGLNALRVTKAWMNELDGSMDDSRFDAPVRGSTPLASGDEAAHRLREFWNSRR